MLRICIPVHNEATTIGVLLWRLRAVFQGFSREYDVVVYDDASSDGTAEVLEPYRSVMPLTVLRGNGHRGYAASIDALVRHVAADDEYARRDAMVLLQGDFTESPEHLPELVKRFEGGADLVAVHRIVSDATPRDERRLRRWGRWAITPFLRMPPVADPFTGFRLVRISVLRDLLKALGARPVCAGDGWAANIDFALNVTPFARRIENVEFAPRYDVRQRASRRRGWPDVVALFHWARAARRSLRPTPGGKPMEQPARGERAADAAVLASQVADRVGTTSAPGNGDARTDRSDRRPRPERGGRSAQDGGDGARTSPRTDRPTEGRGAREERAMRGDSATPRDSEREKRRERAPREPARPENRLAENRLARPPRPAPVAPQNATDSDDSPEVDLLVPASGAGPSLSASAPARDEAVASAEIGDETSGQQKARRRRRRSKKGGGGIPRNGDEASGELADDATAGTSESHPGHDGAAADAAAGGEAGGANKRRSRRRRRGRRPGGTERVGQDGSDGQVAPPVPE